MLAGTADEKVVTALENARSAAEVSTGVQGQRDGRSRAAAMGTGPMDRLAGQARAAE